MPWRTPRYALTAGSPPAYGDWDQFEGERSYGGRFDLAFDHQLIAGSRNAPAWQFLIEADGYEPFVTRVLPNDAPTELDCRLKAAPVRHPVDESHSKSNGGR